MSRERLALLQCFVLLLLAPTIATTNRVAPLWGWTEDLLPEYENAVAEARSTFSETTFVFCFSTGHVGTSALGTMFNNKTAGSMSVNELYVPDRGANALLKTARNHQDGRWVWNYVLRKILPAFLKKSRTLFGNSKTSTVGLVPKYIFEFGHQMNVYGILSVFLQMFPNSTKVTRLRRTHCEVIESFLANPPICPFYSSDERRDCVQNCPGDPDTIFKPLRSLWDASKLSRIMWYIDEVEMEWRELLNKYPNLVYKEFFWEKRGDHGPVEHNASFDNMVQTLQRWVGLDVVSKTSTGRSKHIRDHIQHKGLSTSTESSPIYTSLKNRIHEMKLEYLDSLSTNTRGLATQDSAAFVDCSHRFEMKESQVFK